MSNDKKIELKRKTDEEIKTYFEQRGLTPPSNLRLTDADIGKMVEGQGIYIGFWQPKGLSRVFNVFAAPEDLPVKMNYEQTVKYMAGLKNWHGQDGASYPTDEELRKAMADGNYTGGWVVPPREVLNGRDKGSTLVTADSLFAHKDRGALRGTLKIDGPASEKDWPPQYLTSTRHTGGVGEHFWCAAAANDFVSHDKKSNRTSYCRPVRFVENPTAKIEPFTEMPLPAPSKVNTKTPGS